MSFLHNYLLTFKEFDTIQVPIATGHSMHLLATTMKSNDFFVASFSYLNWVATANLELITR